MTMVDPLRELPTLSLILDERRMLRNIDRLRTRVDALGVALRPHLKTNKSVDVAERPLTGGNGPATVSTLREAEVFAAAGVKDILYAVGVSPDKLARVLALRAAGCDLMIVLDSAAQTEAVTEASRGFGDAFPC
jgi:D-serine deaminase-like pyridoxal phosphate-dependent protein